jgi:hypothetical protein
MFLLQWLDECLERHQVQQQQQQQQQQRPAQVSAAEDNSGSNVPQQLFAPVVGAGLVQERERSAKAAAGRAVAGEPPLPTMTGCCSCCLWLN